MKVVIFVFATAIVLLIGFLLLNNRSSQTAIQNTPTPSPTPLAEKVAIKASFTIITGNITRSFKAEKYYHLSPDVYIEASDPTIVHVTKSGTSWDDFFKTLPMKLTKQCLTTGDGEAFCDGTDGSLKFYLQSKEGSPHLNDIEDKDLLDKEIKEGDKALIKFISS